MLPSGFDEKRVRNYQRIIDRIAGTRDGRPLILLDWAPNRFRWMPYRLGSDPEGYTFPSFCSSRDENGELHSPERWGLWMRNEREQYGVVWEAGRYAKDKRNNCVYDIKGPCPSEKYTELRLHAHHDGDCCPCSGYECACDDHCHGKYAEPNEFLFDWIRRAAYESSQDPDVQPFEDARFFESPHAQQQIISDAATAADKQKAWDEDFDRRTREEWLRHPVSTTTPNGVLLLD